MKLAVPMYRATTSWLTGNWCCNVTS